MKIKSINNKALFHMFSLLVPVFPVLSRCPFAPLRISDVIEL